MKKLLIPLILILLIVPSSYASVIQEVTISIANILMFSDVLGYDLEELKTAYNQNLNKVPWVVKKIIGNEKINLYLATNAKEVITISGITENAKIISVQQGLVENPTLEIHVTEEIINKLKNQEITIEQAIENKLVIYKSLRVRTSIKLWLADKLSFLF